MLAACGTDGGGPAPQPTAAATPVVTEPLAAVTPGLLLLASLAVHRRRATADAADGETVRRIGGMG